MSDFFAEDYENPVFLSGGGEMGELTRQFDWASTAVGPVKNWPQSLRMTVAMILSSKAPMFLWWGNDLLQFYNDAYRPSFGEQGKHPKALGQTGKDCWPEIWPVIKPMIDQVMSGGGGTYNENQLIPIYRNGSLEDVYWTFSYNPVLDDSYKIGGVLVVCQETTREIKALQNLELSEARFRSVVEQAPMAIGLLSGPEMIIEAGNDKIFEVWGKDSSITGLPILEGLPEIKDQDFPKLLQEVYQSGKPYFGESVLAKLDHNGQPRDLYFDFTYTPLKDPAGSTKGVMVLANDITEEFDAKKDLQASEAMLRSVIASSPSAMGIFVGRELVIEMPNQAFIDMMAKGPDIAGKPLRQVLPDMVGQGFDEILHQVLASGEPYFSKEQAVKIHKDGATIYVDLTCQPKRESDDTITGVLIVATDITEQVLARQKVERAETSLRGAIELAQLGTYEIDLTTGVLKYSDRLKKWFGVQKEEVITFEKVYAAISPADLPAVVAAVNRAIEPGSDGLYDMEYTMDETKTGFARILRVQGKVFYDRHGNPVTMVGTAQDVTEQRKIQHALEIQVQQRTEELESANEELAAGNEELAAINEEFQFINDELNRTNALLASSNDNLQQFAYVASHDLQEPLRKVQSFGDLLMSRYGQQLGSGQDLVRRMQEAANRMSTLIQDLLIFSRVSSADPAATVVVRLDQVIESVLGDLELIIQELGARITIDRLPQVTGDQVQLSQLFQNLLSNALKFQNAGATPIVRISYARITNNDLPVTSKTIISSPNYHRIDVVDNGIGFDIAYTERIFQVFQRLHGRSEYAGTGIGLAICEKVVLNHGGAILAASTVGQGSTFTVILPSGPE
jgi:PAS domain S-box-containing protein